MVQANNPLRRDARCFRGPLHFWLTAPPLGQSRVWMLAREHLSYESILRFDRWTEEVELQVRMDKISK